MQDAFLSPQSRRLSPYPIEKEITESSIVLQSTRLERYLQIEVTY